jgi:hypothetical protein
MIPHGREVSRLLYYSALSYMFRKLRLRYSKKGSIEGSERKIVDAEKISS